MIVRLIQVHAKYCFYYQNKTICQKLLVIPIFMLFIHLLNINKAIQTMSLINEIKDFIFGNYYKRIEFSKKISYNSIKDLTKNDLLLLTNELIKNIP